MQNQDIENAAKLLINKEIFSAGIFNISSKSILIIDVKNLIKSILEKFPEIQEVTVQREFPHNIILKVKERKPFAVFCGQNDKCFLVDEKGVIFRQIEKIPEDMVVVKKSDSKETHLGENIIDKNIMNDIAKIQSNLKNNFQIDIKEVTVSDALIFKTSETWLAYFDPAGDMNMQTEKLDTLLRNEISPSTRKNLQYIYLQYKDKVYYK